MNLLSPKFSLLVVWLSLWCDYLLLTMIIPLAPRISPDAQMAGLLFSVKAIVQILASPLVARVVDHGGDISASQSNAKVN